MLKRRGLTVWLLPLILLLWVLLISYLSSQSYQEQSIQPILKLVISEERARELLPDWTIQYGIHAVSAKKWPYKFMEFVFRKSMHVLIYGVLMAAAYAATKLLSQNLWLRLAIGLGIVAIMALMDEWNQLRSGGGRTGVYQDVILDLAGASMVCLLILFYKLISYLIGLNLVKRKD